MRRAERAYVGAVRKRAFVDEVREKMFWIYEANF
jgi:hypothetical protein